MKSKFVYEGPVCQFGRLLTNKWRGETWATSERKALSNLSYRFKTEHNMVAGAKIELDADFMHESTAIEDEYGQA